MYCVGNIAGPQTFLPDEAPGYTTGFLVMMVCFGTGLLTTVVLRFYLWKQNQDRASACLGGDAETVDANTLRDFMDKTDREIPEFRYVL